MLQINGKTHAFSPNMTVLSLLTAAGFAPDRVAVEQNGVIIRRSDFAQTPIADGDVLEIVQFVGGG